MIIAYIFGCLVSVFLGLVEAILYSKKGNKAFKGKDEHRWIYMPLRLFIGVYALSYNFMTLEECFFVFLCNLLAFAFFHDGFYYLGRKWIDGAYKGFLDMTKGSSAKISLSPIPRIVLLICSWGLLLMGWLKNG